MLPCRHPTWEVGSNLRASSFAGCLPPPSSARPFLHEKERGPFQWYTGAGLRRWLTRGGEKAQEGRNGRKEGKEKGRQFTPHAPCLPWVHTPHVICTSDTFCLASPIFTKGSHGPFQSPNISMLYLNSFSTSHLVASLENTNQIMLLP